VKLRCGRHGGGLVDRSERCPPLGGSSKLWIRRFNRASGLAGHKAMGSDIKLVLPLATIVVLAYGLHSTRQRMNVLETHLARIETPPRAAPVPAAREGRALAEAVSTAGIKEAVLKDMDAEFGLRTQGELLVKLTAEVKRIGTAQMQAIHNRKMQRARDRHKGQPPACISAPASTMPELLSFAWIRLSRACQRLLTVASCGLQPPAMKSQRPQ